MSFPNVGRLQLGKNSCIIRCVYIQIRMMMVWYCIVLCLFFCVIVLIVLLWTHSQRASMLYFADVFLIFFFIPALVGQTAERIFTKLSHVVDIRHHL